MFNGLRDRHIGEEAWLFTKGPSFDDFDMNTAGPLRIGINQACQAIEKVAYCISYWADHTTFEIPHGCIFLNGYDEHGKSVVSRTQPSVETFEPRRLPLFFQYSTMSLAMSYLAWMGVKAIHLIGCDPGQGYAPRFGGMPPLTDEKEILIQKQTRNLVIDMAEKSGIALYDYGRAA